VIKGMPAYYELKYKSMSFDKGEEKHIEQAAKKLLVGWSRYVALEKQTGVPAQFIACLHNMEGNCNFETYLGNGQSIHRRTTIVPKGRGPFVDFESGAKDALMSMGLTSIKGWTLGLELMLAEKFNGTGYLKYHPGEDSPYIWACTSVNDGHGKYVRDGVYDSNAPTNGQVGVAALYKQLEIWGKIKPKYAELAAA
jgi:lysozyme family protein